MKFIIKNDLPIVSVDFLFKNKCIHLKNVLIDTGCATSFFDADTVELVGVTIDPINGVVKRMFGIGGQSELCYEQKLNNIQIGSFRFSSFVLQLGMAKEPYGFDAILGSDFFQRTKTIIDFKNDTIHAG